MKTFSSIYRPKTSIFYGLNNCAKQYLYEFGMWIPVNYELLEIDIVLAKSTELVYGTYKDKDFVMALVVDRGEMLTGKLWSANYDSIIFGPLLLHEYVLLDGTLIKEKEQLILENVAFKYLVDAQENIICQWEKEEIDYFLENII